MDLFGKEPRPHFNDTMRRELSEIIGKEIHESGQGKDLEKCVDDTFTILEYASNENGYELAKLYEEYNYSPDSNLVDILDGVDFEKSQIEDRYIRKWVVNDKIEPTLTINDKVIVKYGSGRREGIITAIKKETAVYHVCIESAGQNLKDSRRTVINYEDAELITEKHETQNTN
mgnify:CR=1 FL=1